MTFYIRIYQNPGNYGSSLYSRWCRSSIINSTSLDGVSERWVLRFLSYGESPRASLAGFSHHASIMHAARYALPGAPVQKLRRTLQFSGFPYTGVWLRILTLPYSQRRQVPKSGEIRPQALHYRCTIIMWDLIPSYQDGLLGLKGPIIDPCLGPNVE